MDFSSHLTCLTSQALVQNGLLITSHIPGFRMVFSSRFTSQALEWTSHHVSHLRLQNGLHLRCKIAQRNPFSQAIFIYISESTSVEKTLLVRHLPSQLSDDDKEELFTHFGAVRVKVMGTKGAMVRKRYLKKTCLNKSWTHHFLQTITKIVLVGRMTFWLWGHRERDHMVVGFITIYAYQHQRCEFESRSGEVCSIQHYIIKFVSDLRQVGGFLWFPVKHHTPLFL